jgi:hypothetical protein
VLSALLIKDQNSEENSNTYLIMFSLTIAGLQGIIPKLMSCREDGSDMQEGISEDLPHWQQKGLGSGLTLHRHGL